MDRNGRQIFQGEDRSAKRVKLNDGVDKSTSTSRTGSQERMEAKQIIEHTQQTSDDNQRRFDFSVSDFAKIVKTKSFVDKTLLLKHVFTRSSTILITAPRRFGKSTNIDMVKRFLEIKMNIVDSTENYRVFKDNNLKIFRKEEKFFNQHFGKYPVVHVDFAPLSGVRDFKHMLNVFKIVLSNSYEQHKYLLEAPNVKQGFDLSDFKNNMLNTRKKSVDQHDLKFSLVSLVTILYMYFDKEVVVLIDNYDAFYIGALSAAGSNEDIEEILSFLETATDRLLNNNACVKQALLMGVLPVTGNTILLNGSYVDCYRFMHEPSLCEYFGLNSDELDHVLGNLFHDREEKARVKREIDDYYSRYSETIRGVQIYSIWSVLQYIYRREVQNFGCSQEYIKTLQPLFKECHIRRKLAGLLTGHPISLDLSQPLSTKNITDLNKIITSESMLPDISFSIADKLFVLLYHFGYLSIESQLEKGRFFVEIPNDDVKHELAKVYLETNRTYYNNQEYVDKILCAVDSFKPGIGGQTVNENVRTFCKVLHLWFDKFPVEEKKTVSKGAAGDSPLGLLGNLFVSVLAQPKYTTPSYFEISSRKFSCILLKNEADVVVCLVERDATRTTNAEIVNRGAPRDSLLKRIATNRELLESLFSDYNDRCAKIIIEVALKKGNTMSPEYCYLLKEDDKLDDIKTLSFQM